MTTVALSSKRLAIEINAEHEAVGRAGAEMLEHARKAGELLVRAKAEVGHGGWLGWLSGNFDGSERTARRYMQVCEQWAEIEAKRTDVADLSFTGALKAIAEPREPEELKTCDTCGREWLADFGFCPYCNISPEARVVGLERDESVVAHHTAPIAPRSPLGTATEKPEPYDKLKMLRSQREAAVAPFGRTPPRTPVPQVVREFIRLTTDLPEVTDAEISALDTNEMMVTRLRSARDLIDRIIRAHSQGE